MTQRIWVMDRGMVSEGNITFLRERKASYIIGTPKSELSHFQTELLEKENWQQVQDGLEARLVKHPDGESEKYVLCRSKARGAKELAMLARQSDGLSEQLGKINAWLERSPQHDKEKVGRRIGRWLGKYPAAAKIIEAKVQDNEKGLSIGLQYYSLVEAGQKAFRNKGSYLLRTNCKETDSALLWR